MIPRRLLLAAVLVLGAVAAAVAQQQQQPLASRSDLAALYSLRGSLGIRAREWPAKADPCTAWAGVACRAGRVVGVTVAGFRRTRLASRAPVFAVDGLRGLTALELFNASRFPLPGAVPAWFGPALPRSLAVLDLRYAAVNGTLPSDLGASGNLTSLLLSGNSLSGQVPGSLLSVGSLRVLDLSANNFTGELPNVSVAAGDGAAWLFNVSGNSLYGVASYAIGALKRRFRLVDVSSNYLDGIWNGSDATVDVSTNCFSGVPAQRRRADCEEFYKRVGVRLVDIPAPTSSPQPQPSPQKKQGISKNLLIGIIAAAAALVVMFLAALMFCYMRRSRRSRRQRGGGRGVETNEEGARMRRRDSSVNPVASSPVSGSPRASNTPKDAVAVFGELSYEQLVRATGGFADDNLLKHGHSGDIYRGVLESGANVIVKKIGAKSINKNSSELDFYSRYSHERIVPLLGHWTNDNEEFLAYKYMPKADLTNALHKKPEVDTEDGLLSLDWITRLKIAIGVAEAMCFLHDECSPPFVHRDIQASSVLLDDKFEVRLGSMSNICAQQNVGSQNVFSRILRSSRSLDKNTSGPPATCSYDIYCFGKVILELVTGNFGVSGSNNAGSEEWLANTTNRISINDKDSITNIIDPLLIVDEDHLEEVWAVAIVAKTCLNSKPSRRPSARYVLKALENPLRVVRAGSRSNSARLRSSSSRSSWQSAFLQGNRYQSYEIMSPSGRLLDRRGSVRSHISGGEASSSFKRSLREIAPDPEVVDEDVVV